MTFQWWWPLVACLLLVVVLLLLKKEVCCGRYLAHPDKRGYHLHEWHHGYAGLLAMIPVHEWWQWFWFAWVVDDLVGQHIWHLMGFPNWRSPFHYIYRYLFFPFLHKRWPKVFT